MTCNPDRLDQLTQEVQVGTMFLPEYVDAFLACNPDLVEQAMANPSSESLDAIAGPLLERAGIDDPLIEADVRGTIVEVLTATAEAKRAVVGDSAKDNLAHVAADPVMLFKGQFVHEVDDITIRGAGIDFFLRRTYKNQVIFNGPLGYNWTHNFHVWLRDDTDSVFRATGDLREEPYTRHPRFGEALNGDFDYWMPPDGKHAVIVAEGNSYALRLPNGARHIFEQDPAHSFLHRLARIEDRFGNYLDLRYQNDLLAQIEVNHPLRLISFDYDSQHRICEITDYTGRAWRYTYDSYGDLIAVSSPVTDRYTCGLTVSYEYSSAFQTADLQHNLTSIIDAAGQLYLENEYGDAPGLPSFNRVVRQRQGTGVYLFEYEEVDQLLDRDYPDEQRPTNQTILVERNGQPVRHVYNRFGNLLLREQCILDGGLPRALTEHHRYNRDANVVASLSPEGVLTQWLYGRDHFTRQHGLTPNGDVPTDALTWRERHAFGRLLSLVRRDGYAPPVLTQLTQGAWGSFPDVIDGLFPAGMGDRANDIITKYSYEPEFGQLATESDPRYTVSADPNALNEHPQHDATLTRYAHAGATQLLSEIRHPTPTLPDGTQGAGVIEQFTDYDSRGRLLRQVNAVGAVTAYSYVPEDPGDVRSGYPQQVVEDAGGLAITTTHAVDERGRVVETTLPRGVNLADGRFHVRTVYNELDQIIETVSSPPFAFVTRRFYDRTGNLEREERPVEDENGIAILGGMEQRTFCYDQEFKLKEESLGGADRDEHLVAFHHYDHAGLRVSTTLPEGNQLRAGYDGRMLPISQTRGAGTDDAATTRTEHDGDGRIVREIDARGNVSTRTIDAFGGTVVEEDPLGHLTLTTYDTASNVTCTRSFELRADGYYLLARDETDYDELGRVLRSGVNRFDDPLGPLPRAALDTAFLPSPGPGTLLATERFHDQQGRLIRSIDPMQRERTFTYDGLDRLVLTTDPLGNQVATTYDAHHNLIRVDRIDLVRDAATGSILGQRAFASTATFDELDRMLTSTDSLGNTTTFAYDSRNNQVRRVDPLGNVVRIDFDIYNRQIAEHAELRDTGTGDGVIEETTTTRLTYDANGNLTGVVDALGRDTRFMYDALDRRRTIIYPDGSRHASDFDPDNNLTRTTDNNGLRRLYTVDELGRTTGITVDASLLAPGVDVAGATFERYGYDALDRRLAAENDFALCEVRWSSLGWPLEETTTFTIPAAPLATPLTIVRQFDDAGFVVGLTYPSGRQVRFERDDLDRLVAVRNVANGQGYPGDVNAAASYDIARCGYLGRQRGDATYGNGATVAWAHDGAGRVIETVHTAPAGPILTLQYLFDAAGNVRSRNNIQPPGDAGEVFAYDSLYRLADVDARAIASFPAATLAPAAIIPPTPIPNRQAEIDALIGSLALPAGERTFTYDLVGNRFAERDGEDIDYAVNTLDQYTQVTENTTGAVTNLVHDDNGNLIQDGQRRFVYDSVNRLVRVIDAANDATISIFHHDARGRRMLEIQDGQTTHLQWDGNDLIAEYRAGIPFAQYVFDDGIDRPLQIAAGGGEHWYHTDLVGSVCAMTGRTGAVSATWRYSPFGALTEAPASAPYNPLLYTARRLDDVLGQYDFRAREYSPELGRFLQRDPAGMVDGSNLYAYARNGPLHAIDSFGTERTEVARGQTQPDAGVPDAGHWINPIAGPVGPDNPQVWVRHDDTVLPDAVHSVGQFGRDVVVEGGGWWLRQGERALDTLVWGITGSLDLITRPVAAIEEEVCGPGCFAYNPVGASVSGVRTALTVLSRGLKASRGLKVRKAARAIDRADDVVRGQRPGRVGRVARSGGTGKIPWGTWEDYPKVTVGGKQYAKVGDRLYTEHAVHRIQPGGYRGTSSKWFGGTSSRDSSGGFPQIQQSGGYRTSSGPYTYGRGVPPIWVEEALQAPGVPQANGTISHTLGSLEVIVNKAGAVVTVETY